MTRDTPAESPQHPRPPWGLLPPVWFLLALVASAALAWIAPLAEAVPRPWNYLGLVLVVAGLALAIAGERQFKRRGTTVKPFQPSTALVTDGVFRYTRNPMYLGIVTTLLGVHIAMAVLSPFLVFVAFAFFLDRCFVRREESMMHAQFGADYDAYRRRVRRWF